MARYILALFAVLALPLAAQESFPLRSVEWKGLERIRSQQAQSMSGLKLNQPSGKVEFDAAQKRLVDSGWFDSAGYEFRPTADGKGYSLTFQVAEASPLYKVKFEELGVPDAQLNAAIRAREPLYTDRIPPTPGVLKRVTAVVQEAVGANAKAPIMARVVMETDEPVVIFRPNTPRKTISDVLFQGNRAIPSGVLQTEINRVATGSTWSERHLRELLEMNIVPLYEAKGYPGVTFTNIEPQPAPGNSGVRPLVTLDEGPAYALGKVNIAGELPWVPKEREKILKEFPLPAAGSPYNRAELLDAARRLAELLKRYGYANAKAELTRDLNKATRTAEATITVLPGDKYTWGRLILKGLDINGESAVRKLWAKKAGEPYDSGYPTFFVAQLKERDLFDNLGDIKPVPEIDEENRVVDITLDFAPGLNPILRKSTK